MMRSTLSIAALVIVVHAAIACARQSPAEPQNDVVADFNARVEQYVDLRNRADNGAPPLKQTDDPAKIHQAQETLAARIRKERAGARPGDLFSPEIAAHFRRLLRPEADRGTRESIKQGNPGDITFKINSEYPDSAGLSTAPPNVLATLPELPKDIEYRFVGKHLILFDARANLIIDYMPNAIA